MRSPRAASRSNSSPTSARCATAATFPARAIHAIAAATPRGGSLIAKAQAVARLWRIGTSQAVALLRHIKPARRRRLRRLSDRAAAARGALLGVPTILHEANAVMGRANRFLAARVDAIAAGLSDARRSPAPLPSKVVVTGNPVRPAVLEAATHALSELRRRQLAASRHRRLAGRAHHGGYRAGRDRGAARTICARASASCSRRAARTIARVAAIYARLGVARRGRALLRRSAGAHRAGASRHRARRRLDRRRNSPSSAGRRFWCRCRMRSIRIRRPMPRIARTGGRRRHVVAQSDFTPQWLARASPSALACAGAAHGARARRRKRVGIADAAERLADLVSSVARPDAAKRRPA